MCERVVNFKFKFNKITFNTHKKNLIGDINFISNWIFNIIFKHKSISCSIKESGNLYKFVIDFMNNVCKIARYIGIVWMIPRKENKGFQRFNDNVFEYRDYTNEKKKMINSLKYLIKYNDSVYVDYEGIKEINNATVNIPINENVVITMNKQNDLNVFYKHNLKIFLRCVNLLQSYISTDIKDVMIDYIKHVLITLQNFNFDDCCLFWYKNQNMKWMFKNNNKQNLNVKVPNVSLNVKVVLFEKEENEYVEYGYDNIKINIDTSLRYNNEMFNTTYEDVLKIVKNRYYAIVYDINQFIIDYNIYKGLFNDLV